MLFPLPLPQGAHVIPPLEKGGKGGFPRQFAFYNLHFALFDSTSAG